MDGHSRPYFSGIDQSLNFQQKEALTQGIQQVISTTPTGFESFDFKFARRDARIYRLKTGVILLVVTDEHLDTVVYNDTVAQLKDTLESDPHSAVSTFRLLAGSTTLNRPTEGGAADAPSESPASSPSAPVVASAPGGTAIVTWGSYLATLNALTDATAQYLGKIVVANTWRTTRPKDDHLDVMQLDRNGHFSVTAEAQIAPAASIDQAIHAALDQWVSTFIKRCSMIIRDYQALVIEQQLTPEQRAVLQVDQAPVE
ncbi:hypothetical protein [Leptolyngbya iicbica]|uniref:Uncharacterized protein n=2 Tax=Cyanophyceae TaxID=3028117 RepID=A0A4Q7E6K5_9CYAN|nr:hypothetical protein [Leptolyngbya sp. LK]RZM77724.1 hypothetical protein DYY88_14165 [Leptolyngbya sp. LK]